MRSSLEAVARTAGAVIAFLAPGAAIVGAAVTVASPGGIDITAGEWITAAAAALVASAAVEAQVVRRARQTAARRAREEIARLQLEAGRSPPEPPRGG
jgi:hypothetical protein